MIMMEYSTETTQASSNIKEPQRNFYPPTTTTTIASHFPPNCWSRKQPYFSVTSIISLWFLMVVWCSPKYVANGLPLVLTDASGMNDVILDSALILPDEQVVVPRLPWHWNLHKQNKNTMIGEMDEYDESGDNVQNYGDYQQETTGLSKHNNNELRETMVRPRRKKGLSYLTKYYTEAFLNNTPSTNGGSSANSSAQSQHDSSSNFFGVSNGGSFSTSRENKFPSSVRRKLSFHPPMTSHSAFMRPWSRVSNSGLATGGRTPTMRLRWGK